MAAHPKGRSGEPKSTLNQYYVEILQENKRLVRALAKLLCCEAFARISF